jgi:transcription elongation factor/antiterminator RfaH
MMEAEVAAHWYVLHSKPLKEAFLWEQLSLHRIESYYPCIQVRAPSSHARRVRPYFPGYLFGYIDLEQINLSTIQWMPGAAGIVSFGGAPSSVPDHVIAAIRRRVDEVNAAGRGWLDRLKPGDLVTIQEGPFSGYEAIFDARLSGDERVRVLLKLLNTRKFPLELPGSQIQRKKQ